MKSQLTEDKRDLPNDPMPRAIDADAPDNQPNGTEDGGRVGEPQAHLRLLDTGIALCQANDEPVAEAARAKDLGDEGADDEAEEQQTLALGRIGGVGDGDERDDAENPPVPEEM